MVLAVDDDPDRLELIWSALIPEFDVARFHLATQLLDHADLAHAGAVVADVRMPAMDGMELLQALRARDPDLAVVLITSYGTVSQAVDSIKLGAHDYLTWDFQPDRLVASVLRAVQHTQLSRRARGLEALLDEGHRFSGVLGRSRAMQRVFQLLDRVAASDATVLLIGESGTGKELVTRALHHAGPRSSGPFVPVNCGALPRELVESELFGHARGAFSGAHGETRGLVEEAHGGTLFLDEVGELPLELQVKLNRFLQEGEIRQVGATRSRLVDVRVVAASNVDLHQRVRQGLFRSDLFYRLNTFPIPLPALREREDDVALLAHAFLERARIREGRQLLGFDPEALALLTNHDWPGNVRELEATVTRALLLAHGQRIGADCLPPELRGNRGAGLRLPAFADRRYRDVIEEATAGVGRAYLSDLLARHGGNVKRASTEAGVGRETLHRLLRRHGVAPGAYRRTGK